MHTTRNTREAGQHLVALAVTGALVALPLLGATAVTHAAPPRYAQAGRRGHVGMRSRTYSGVVAHNFSGSQFQLTLDRGGSLRVDARNIARGGFRVGDDVTVGGHYNADRSLFVATSVSVISSRALRRHRR